MPHVLTLLKRDPDGREVWQVHDPAGIDTITAHFTGPDARRRAVEYASWIDGRDTVRKGMRAIYEAGHDADDLRYGLTMRHVTNTGDA